MIRLILSAFFAFFVSVGLVYACEETYCGDKSGDGGPKECRKFKVHPEPGLGRWKACIAEYCRKHQETRFCKDFERDRRHQGPDDGVIIPLNKTKGNGNPEIGSKIVPAEGDRIDAKNNGDGDDKHHDGDGDDKVIKKKAH